MCATCGCSDVAGGDGHRHPHPTVNRLAPPGGLPAGRLVRLEHDVLLKNDAIAARNRAWLAERSVVALNLVSSPGAGKTTLLERTLRELGSEVPVAVVEGDQETPLDGLDALVEDLSIIRLPGIGHFAPWEAGDQVANALRDFLARESEATAPAA